MLKPVSIKLKVRQKIANVIRTIIPAVNCGWKKVFEANIALIINAPIDDVSVEQTIIVKYKKERHLSWFSLVIYRSDLEMDPLPCCGSDDNIASVSLSDSSFSVSA